MSELTLAQASMLSLYSAMGVFTLAMLGYAAYLAGLVPAKGEARDADRAAAKERELRHGRCPGIQRRVTGADRLG